jgi:hypothetical protein
MNVDKKWLRSLECDDGIVFCGHKTTTIQSLSSLGNMFYGLRSKKVKTMVVWPLLYTLLGPKKH